MEFTYKIENYYPYESRIFVIYTPTDTTFESLGGWVFITPEMTPEQITEAVLANAPLKKWNVPKSLSITEMIGLEATATVVEPPPYVAPPPTVDELLIKIDKDTDAIYGAMLGNRAEEYTLAATEARDFKTTNYTGDVPGSVQSWATAKNWAASVATDDIVATADNWLGAQAAIRAQRLLRKEQIRAAADDEAAAATVYTAWRGFVTYMRGQLGI